MRSVSRRGFVAGATAGASLGILPFSSWVDRQVKADTPMTRYDVSTSQGQVMLEKYARAAAKMMDATQIDEKSPSSWLFQWYTHAVPRSPTAPRGSTIAGEIDRVYAGAAPNDPGRLLALAMWSTCQAHQENGPPQDERMFLPWHRMYVYYFERIIRKVLRDDSFTLPYWDYTTRGKRAIPEQFRLPNDPLYKALYRPDRNDGTQPGTANVNSGQPIDLGRPNSPLNLAALGSRDYARRGVVPGFNDGLDSGLHGSVHVLVGNTSNMGQPPWAAKDPIFWLHHSNIDRLWASWNKGGRANPGGTWLTQNFVFADENGGRVGPTVRDFVDTVAISVGSYKYDKLEPLPTAPAGAAAALVASNSPIVIAKPTAAGAIELKGGGAVSVPLAAVAAPMSAHVALAGDTGRIFLVLQKLNANAQPGILYDVYLDAPSGAGLASSSTSVGSLSFFNSSANDHQGPSNTGIFSFDVTEVVRAANASGAAGAPTVRILPAGVAEDAANPVIGDISLVRQ